MPRATPSLLTQLDCENADANIKDGRPAARLLTLGGGPCLQITPGKLQADGRYALSKYWLFSYSLEGHAHRIGLGSCDKLPLDRARVEALLLQKQVENGIDPLEQRHEQRKERWIQNIIVYAVAKEYRTDGVNPAVWRHGLQPLLAKPSKVRRVVHHPAMRYAQVPAFMAELAKDSSTAARALTFTVLTGLRSAPVRYAV